jgi:hypothetical protein
VKFKSFAQTMKDAAKDLAEAFEHDAKRATTDPDNTATGENEVGERTARSATSEMRKQVSEVAAEAEKKTAEIMEKAAKARRAVNGKPWPLWKKFIIVFTAITGLTLTLSLTPDTKKEEEEKRLRVELAWDAEARRLADKSNTIILNMQRYNNVMNEVRNAPPPMIPPEVPRAVAAVADAYVEVTATENTPDSTPQTFTTTLGQFYTAVPEARRQIEEEAPRIQHDYDKSSADDPNSCANRHCLDPQHHKEFEVNGFDGKAMKFKY